MEEPDVLLIKAIAIYPIEQETVKNKRSNQDSKALKFTHMKKMGTLLLLKPARFKGTEYL